jgi:hypothetical protein
MTREHQVTPEEEAYGQLLDETWEMLSEPAHTVMGEAQSAAYAANMVRSYCFQPEEYEQTMEKMRLTTAELSNRECELLAKLWRAALAAAASIDSEDFETLAGYRVYSGTSTGTTGCFPAWSRRSSRRSGWQSFGRRS